MLFWIILLYSSSLGIQAKQANPISISGFKQEDWKFDSLGCKGLRSILSNKLILNKEKIIGRTKEEVEFLLGAPNSISSNKMIEFYFLNSGPQCIYVDKNGYDSLEVSKLMLVYNKDSLKSLSTIIP
ncbi:hypothetical protein ACE38W_20320 [Chitinophaga sp. Hz27]|uniref:hypothetical protein n=1 Tax=Chitinophaga sp. Hz27 TaxID=3347169 RepID=UPI0035D78BF3